MSGIADLVRIFVLMLLVALAVILVTRRLSVPYTLGLVVVGLGMSFLTSPQTLHLTPDLVLFVFLPALLFEGAWSSSVRHLRENWIPIFLLAVPGLLLELLLIALPLHFFTGLIWEDAFLLAAILTPTDPVAVLGLFRQLKVNVQLSTIIEGESLFNDGVAGVFYEIFLVLVLATTHGTPLSAGQAWLEGTGTFLLEAGGGIVTGVLVGFLVSRFVKLIDDALIETTITIITAYGVYLLADFLHTSGILAVIITGLIVGSYGQRTGMSETTRHAVENFWSVIAFVANALVFLLVGVQLNPSELLSFSTESAFFFTAALAIIAVLLARFIMVVLLPRRSPSFGIPQHSWRFIIFWSGLRGALSLALVLALPLDVPQRSTLIISTYAVVLFTLLVQGFSLRAILKRLPSVTKQ